MQHKRGDKSPDGKLVFWRMNRGKPLWVPQDRFAEKRAAEKARAEMFFSKRPDYVAPSHAPEESRRRSKQYREANPEKRKAQFRSWSLRNVGHLRAYAKRKYQESPEFRARILAACSFRRNSMSRKLSGSQPFEIRFLYSLAKAFSCGGEKHVVDHYLPIKPKHKMYCGLTNTSNLRVITAVQNAVKKNKCPLAQQAQNAQIGKIGTAPAQMGGMQTQGLNA
jgi:hypothetical protein